MLRFLYVGLSCVAMQLRYENDSLYCQLIAQLFPYVLLFLYFLPLMLLMFCGVPLDRWHATSRRLLALYSRYGTHSHTAAGVHLLVCLWRHEWVTAAWSVLRPVWAVLWPASNGVIPAWFSPQWLQKFVHLLTLLIDACTYPPADPSVDQLLSLVLQLLEGGFEFITL